MKQIGLRQASRFTFAVMGIVAAWLVPNASFADEGGVSFWLPGTYGSLAAEQQVPGWSLSLTDYHTSVSASGSISQSREIQIGRFPVGLTATANANFNETMDMVMIEPSYVFATPFFGGQASVGLSGAYGRDSGALAGTLSGTLNATPFALSETTSESVWGFGDLSPVFSLRWNKGADNFMTYVAGNIPVGAYNALRLANIGLGYGAIDAGGAYTYYNSETGHEFSGTLGFTYNLINPATQYQSGVDIHFDWGASHFFTEDFHAGLVGYVYKQIGCDGGSGDRVGCFQSQVVGIGPQVGFIFPVGSMEGYLNLKVYDEFAAENRPEGWNAWVTFSLSPSAPAASAQPRPIITK